MHALILADGDVPTRPFLDRHWPRWLDEVGLVIAADGGARHAVTLGVSIDVWVGDGDSVGADLLETLTAAGVAIERAPMEKDETDTELAIRHALAHGARGLVILGATGGPRLDHELANIGLLTMPGFDGRSAVLYTPCSRVVLLRGDDGDRAASYTLLGRPGDLVSLLPFAGDAEGVVTTGLRYPLAGERLRLGTARGISNVVETGGARVHVASGRLLIIETPATIDG